MLSVKFIPLLFLVVALFLHPFPVRSTEETNVAMNQDLNLPDEIQAQRSEEEEEWFKKFLKGTMIVNGWHDISSEILEKAETDKRKALSNALIELGEKIGREWARNNDIRRIDTSMLQAWGKRLKSTARKEPEKLALEIRKIDAEASRLLE